MKIDGQTVVDAKKPLKLRITKTDCKLGKSKKAASCAAARCLLRLPEVEAARVHISRTYVKIDNKWKRFDTSKPLRSEIIAFDRGGSFEPGEYLLNPVSPSQRAKIGTRQGSSAKGARDKGSKTRTPMQRRAKPHTVGGIREHGNTL